MIPLILSTSEILNTKASGEKLLVGERNNINIRWLVHYRDVVVEDKITTASAFK